MKTNYNKLLNARDNILSRIRSLNVVKEKTAKRIKYREPYFYRKAIRLILDAEPNP